MNLSANQIGELFKVIESEGLTISQVISLIKKRRNKVKKIQVMEEINFIINYNQSFEQMIEAGNYNDVNDEITKRNFLFSNDIAVNRKEIRAKLFTFNKEIKTQDIILEMNKFGYRPANLIELLALIASNYEFNNFPIIALDSKWVNKDELCFVPAVNFISGRIKQLDLYWLDFSWQKNFYFLGVYNNLNS